MAGWLIGSLAANATGWRWWVRICVAVAPAIALLIAERKRFVRTPEEMNRPVSLFADEHPDSTPKRVDPGTLTTSRCADSLLAYDRHPSGSRAQRAKRRREDGLKQKRECKAGAPDGVSPISG